MLTTASVHGGAAADFAALSCAPAITLLLQLGTPGLAEDSLLVSGHAVGRVDPHGNPPREWAHSHCPCHPLFSGWSCEAGLGILRPAEGVMPCQSGSRSSRSGSLAFALGSWLPSCTFAVSLWRRTRGNDSTQRERDAIWMRTAVFTRGRKPSCPMNSACSRHEPCAVSLLNSPHSGCPALLLY